MCQLILTISDGGDIGADYYFGQFFLCLFESVFVDGCDFGFHAVDGDCGRNLDRFLVGHGLHDNGVGGSCPVCIAA